MTADHAWRKQAKCRGLDTNLFFGERGEHQTMETAIVSIYVMTIFYFGRKK